MAYQSDINSPEALGRAIQQARMLRGLSQRDISAELGISQRYVSEIETAKPSIYSRRLFDMMQAVGVHLSATIAEDRKAERDE